MTDSISAFFSAVFMNTGLQISPIYLISFCMIAWVIYRMRRETRGFWGWLFPRDMYLHHSTKVDVSLLIIGQLIVYFGVVARLTAVPAVAAYVASVMPFAPLERMQFSPVGLALILVIAADFAMYWSHRAHHTIKVIWPLHAVHHSAKVLTPITAYRQHPLGGLLVTAINTFIIGAFFGVLVGAFAPDATLSEIAGVNAFIVIANLTITNFHHSHIWVSFGPFWERVFISPAQHQVHHSTDPAHFNKNFGQTFAIWDWMFGTLYVTRANESVTFGLDDKADAPLMTQRLWPILWDPLRRMLNPGRQ